MNYSIINIAGKGSYGVVYKIKDLHTNKIHALKKIKISSVLHHKQKELLLNELRIMKYNYSPYLLKLEEMFIERGLNVCIVTPFIRYGDLNTIILARKLYFKEQLIWIYFLQMCLGVKYLHEHNIIHRDLKTSNIYLGEGDKIVIGDFGISKIFNNNQSMSRTFIGTPYYMSPEMLGQQEYDKKADIWSLGCVLYELLTFKMPFNGYNLFDLKRKVRGLNFSKRLYEIRCSKELLKILKQMLQFASKERPTIIEILDDEEVYQHMYMIPYVGRTEPIYDFDKNFREIPNIYIYEINEYIK